MPLFQVLTSKGTLVRLLVIAVLSFLVLVKLNNTVYATPCTGPNSIQAGCTPDSIYQDENSCNYQNETTCTTGGAGSGWSQWGNGYTCTPTSSHCYWVKPYNFSCTPNNWCSWTAYQCADHGACATAGSAYRQCGNPSDRDGGCIKNYSTDKSVLVTPGGGGCNANGCVAVTYACSSANTNCGNGCGGTSCSSGYTCSSGTCVLQNCNSGISCSGSCTASTSNTCSTNNGTKGSCKYTTNTNGGSCTQADAPNQSCTVNACSSGYTCSSGTCCTDFQPVPSCRTSDGSVPDGDCTSTDYLANCSTYCSGSTCCPAARSCLTCGVTAPYAEPNGTCETTSCSATVPCALSEAPAATYSCSGGVSPQFLITWRPVAGTTTYRLYRKLESQLESSKVFLGDSIQGTPGTGSDGLPILTTPDNDVSLTSGVSYEYALQPYNAQGSAAGSLSWSPAVEAVACDTRAPENITDPKSFNTPTILNNKCFDKSTVYGKGWDTLGGIQIYASDNIGVTSVTFKVTNPATGIVVNTFAASKVTGSDSPDTSRDGTNTPLQRTQWRAIIPFDDDDLVDDLGVGNYSIQAEVKDAADKLATSSRVNFRLADLCVRPWIQTTGGDVHSNTGINTPGGP